MSRGFDAFVGNPPWVSYAGRAAQPLEDGRRSYFDAFFKSFAGYGNLQGIFIEQCATHLRTHGRLGLLVPSSMSELKGYTPTRIAHDELCECDPELPDVPEDKFPSIFQPSMELYSTKRPTEADVSPPSVWPMARPDLDAMDRGLVARIARAPLPPHLFGERGLQSSGDDVAHFADVADASRTVALRVGGDIQPFQRAAPSLFADPKRLGPRLREPAEWREVKILIRQTARVPMAARSDGLAFRNSILAGFEDAEYPASFLVAYLNSNPVRWQHYVRHRDARQGMPQLKVGHLRAIPAPPMAIVSSLATLGEQLSANNAGIDAEGQRRLDTLVADAFGMSSDECNRVSEWARELR